MRNRNKLVPPLMILGALIACATTAGTAAVPSSTTAAMPSSPAASAAAPASDLQLAMRKLWADHVIWTREYIVAAVDGAASADAASARLMRNQEEIGSAIAPFYGAAAGAKLTDLLKQHILIAVDLVTAAKAGDAAKQGAADKRWHDNAAEIATFLSGANPNWNKQELTTMLNEHLSLTTQEAVARLQKKWTDDTMLFDRIFTQAMMMADALTTGITKQFPDKVS